MSTDPVKDISANGVPSLNLDKFSTDTESNKPKPDNSNLTMKKLLSPICFCTLIAVGCTPTETSLQSDVITVEGRVSERGNTPFQAWMVETENRNSYILVMDAKGGDYSSSKRYRITGRLYLDQWNGKDYAHLEVISIDDVM